MKTFKNRFGVVVELRDVGFDVSIAKVSLSMRFARLDCDHISGFVLAEILPDRVRKCLLYDGSYVLVSDKGDESFSDRSVPSTRRSLPVLDTDVELEDREVHTVHISLEQLADARNDYSLAGTRFIHLNGTISVELDDHEEDA